MQKGKMKFCRLFLFTMTSQMIWCKFLPQGSKQTNWQWTLSLNFVNNCKVCSLHTRTFIILSKFTLVRAPSKSWYDFIHYTSRASYLSHTEYKKWNWLISLWEIFIFFLKTLEKKKEVFSRIKTLHHNVAHHITKI